MDKFGAKKYWFAFAITAVIFVLAFFASNYLNQKRISEMRSIQDQISIDLQSSETQFDLLGQVSCEDLGNSALSKELNSIAEQLSYMESNRSPDDPEVITLKEYYSILEIKDYILMQKIADKCDVKPIFILYFYSNNGDCPECEKTGYVLTQMRQDYPELRIYSFDYNLNLSALRTLISLYGVEPTLPAMILNGKVYYGFQSTDDIERIIPEIKALRASTTEATSTTATTSSTTKK
ncbi:MAG TPA: hypothetical protein VHF05_00780 [Candidatus Paceibacterota bacterium]|jgi:hypothetical protein|nr:hypothetical protein [Candidatus Paceibacterota bacterium]